MSEPDKKEVAETMRGLCLWLESTVALLPHISPYHPDARRFVTRLHEAISNARTVSDAIDKEEA